jgi:hypothetical protein
MIPGEPAFPDTDFHVPWMAYLSAPIAARLELPPEIVTEHTPDGGLLMIATEERLDPENPEHRRRARLLGETMTERTGYSTYAAQHGRWPQRVGSFDWRRNLVSNSSRLGGGGRR